VLVFTIERTLEVIKKKKKKQSRAAASHSVMARHASSWYIINTHMVPKRNKKVNALIPPHESAIRKKSAQKLASWSGPQMHPQHNIQLPNGWGMCTCFTQNKICIIPSSAH
jgi:hypothetical protein